MDQLDSLEGWVAVKSNPFVDDLLPPRLTFLVAWHKDESKITVTCRRKSRMVSDTDDNSVRYGCYSYQELRGIHEMLCLIHPSLSPYLPYLPEQPKGLMAYISSVPLPDNVDLLCQDLTNYFNIALEICKEKLLISTLFEDPNFDDYFENIGELRRQGYLDQINKAEEEIANTLFERDNCVTMNELESFYEQEDIAVFRYNIALAEYFNYQIQPFLDLREVAFEKLKVAKNNLINVNLGERVKKENAEAITEWQSHYEQALDSIQEIYIKYYTRTSQIYTDMFNRMTEDKMRFGKKAFDIVGSDRYFRLQENMSLEKMQLFLNSKKFCVQERDKVKQEIASLDEKPGVREDIQLLEEHVYRWQLKIYEEHLNILNEEEKLNKTLLHAKLYEIEEQNDEVTFYDAVESLDELDEEDAENIMNDVKYNQDILELKRKLADINRRRAILRNKKSTLEQQCKQKKIDKKESIDRYNQHHSIQMKRDKDKELYEKKKDFISEERKKTIERLKNHKVKYPTPPTIKPLRYQPPSRRKDSLTSLSRQRNKYTQPEASKGKQQMKSIKEKKIQPRKTFVRPKRIPNDNTDGNITFYISGKQEPVNQNDTLTNEDECLSTNISIVPPPPPINIPPPPPPPLPPPPPATLSITPGGKPKPPTLGLANLSEALSALKKPSPVNNKSNKTGLDLSAITSGHIKLKPASNRILQPAKQVDNEIEMFKMIKQGVKLRPVNRLSQSEILPSLSSPSDSHISLLQESMRRINRVVRGTSPDSYEDDSDENEDFDD